MERITADNFITDNKTNKVFISSLIDGETGGLDVDTRSELKANILEFARNGEIRECSLCCAPVVFRDGL